MPPKSSVHSRPPNTVPVSDSRVRRGTGYEMEPVRTGLQKLLVGILNHFPPEQVPLEAWPFVCGKQVSRRTQALSFAGGILRVEVPDAAWRAQLQELSGRYLAGLNQYSAKAVESIEFVLAAGARPEQAQQRQPQATSKSERAVKQRQAGTSGKSSNNRKGNGGNKSKRK